MIGTIPPKQLQGTHGTPTEEAQRFRSDPFSYMDECFQSYGDTFLLPFSADGSFMPTVVISNPEAVRTLFSSAALKYFENKPLAAVDYLIGGTQHLSSAEKAEHLRLKKLLMPSFHGKALQDQAQRIWNIAEVLSQPWKNGEPFWVCTVMRSLALEVTVQTLFGITEGPHYEPLKNLIVEWLDWSTSTEVAQATYFEHLRKDEGPDSPWGKHLNYLRQLDQILYAEIESCQSEHEGARKDVLSMLLASTDEDGNKLSATEVRDNILLMLFAGHDMMASTMSWAMYVIHQNPSVLEKLRQELEDAIFPDQEPDLLKVASLTYLNAVTKEVFRLYSGALLTSSRIVNAPFEFMGYSLEPEMAISPSYYLLHRQPELYPEPEQFRPERFLERDFGFHELAPFGGGHRRCLGDALGEMKLKLTLAAFVSRYHLERTEHEPIKMKIENLLINHCERDFQMRSVVG